MTDAIPIATQIEQKNLDSSDDNNISDNNNDNQSEGILGMNRTQSLTKRSHEQTRRGVSFSNLVNNNNNNNSSSSDSNNKAQTTPLPPTTTITTTTTATPYSSSSSLSSFDWEQPQPQQQPQAPPTITTTTTTTTTKQPNSAYYYGAKQIAKPSNSAALSERRQLTMQSMLVLVMVGLPARGKSYLGRKFELFLRWKGLRAELFNVGKHRRATCESKHEDSSATFFAASNQEGKRLREQIAMEVLEGLLKWLDNGGGIAILDATNSTHSRRKLVEEKCKEHNSRIRVVFIEVLCDDSTILEENIRQKIANSPDFEGMDFETARQDLMKRIAEYEKVYETIADETCSYIKLFNMQSKVHINKIYGQVARNILPYVMSLHVQPRPIYLVRAGLADRAGIVFSNQPSVLTSRDAGLSALGRKFSIRLSEFLRQRHENEDVSVYSSTMPRAIQTGEFLPWEVVPVVALNPMDRGVVDKCPRAEYASKFPDFFARFSQEPFRTRFPGGESYFDLVSRLESFVVEIEAQMNPVVVISHVCTLQALYSYFLGVPVENCMELSIPKHEIIQLIPTVGGSLCEERFSFETQSPSPSLVFKSTDLFSILHTAQQEREHRELTPKFSSPPLMRRRTLAHDEMVSRNKSFLQQWPRSRSFSIV